MAVESLLKPLKRGTKQITTSISPTIYQGFLFPILVSNLSESRPTIGVAIPSQSCPASNADAAASVTTTFLRKKNK